jgi:hypothetical protein
MTARKTRVSYHCLLDEMMTSLPFVRIRNAPLDSVSDARKRRRRVVRVSAKLAHRRARLVNLRVWVVR